MTAIVFSFSLSHSSWGKPGESRGPTGFRMRVNSQEHLRKTWGNLGNSRETKGNRWENLGELSGTREEIWGKSWEHMGETLETPKENLGKTCGRPGEI